MRVLAYRDWHTRVVWWVFRVDASTWRRFLRVVRPLMEQATLMAAHDPGQDAYLLGVPESLHEVFFRQVYEHIQQDEVGRLHHEYDDVEPLWHEMRARWEALQTVEFVLSTPHGDLVVGPERPLWMGIVNLTPDSFYPGSRAPDVDQAVRLALALYQEGADIIDLGGQSTRPGSEDLSPEDEWKRVEPVLRALRPLLPIPISIDTFYARVADRAIQLGADLINDVTAGTYDADMFRVARFHGVPIVLMHYYERIRPMPKEPVYENVAWDVVRFLRQRIEAALQAGVRLEQIVVDPGIGFGKKPEHNLQLIRHLGLLQGLGRPILVGPSRKSFMAYAHAGGPEDRLEGTLAACVWAWMAGARIFRVHDVWPLRKGLAVWLAIQRARYDPSMPWNLRGWL
jgi:dihydropteroate synthase